MLTLTGKRRITNTTRAIQKDLKDLPAQIRAAQVTAHNAKRAYAVRASELSLDALSAALFPGKDGEKRAATNDTERGIAIDYTLEHNEQLQALKTVMIVAQAVLSEFQNRFEALRLVARLQLAERHSEGSGRE